MKVVWVPELRGRLPTVNPARKGNVPLGRAERGCVGEVNKRKAQTNSLRTPQGPHPLQTQPSLSWTSLVMSTEQTNTRIFMLWTELCPPQNSRGEVLIPRTSLNVYLKIGPLKR